ncbi:DNA repair protein RadC [Zooshikella marina]|uniref:RadC family protein n=1 Tax=Zooshikella ganghwensis TaxID=202772 RepID=UPI001BAF7C50|nr:DNA repair protein RadC [Zooshikella ganghwensis]MBU2708745.1 DNA repair protein RadC [Zooshikella ganghwensis]
MTFKRELSMLSEAQKSVINEAVSILSDLYKREDLLVESPSDVKTFCRLQIGHLEHEVFGILFLDNRHRLIKFSQLFRGTINVTSVYPREVVKEALIVNAAAVVFTHNHPSGDCEPSRADKGITKCLFDALDLFDIRVLDHIVVSCKDSYSFSEHGLL